MSKAKKKAPLVKGEPPKPKPTWRVEDERWYEKAACLGAGEASDLFTIATEPSEKAASRELRARNICTMNCPVREDCVIDAWKIGDTGVIRGGNRFVAGVGKYECMLCGTPAAKQGHLCMYCVCKRYCTSCGRAFAAADDKVEPELCPACDPQQNTSRIKKVA